MEKRKKRNENLTKKLRNKKRNLKFNKKIMDKAVNDLLNIKDIRSKVDSLGIETKKAIEYYTNMNADFLIF